MLTFLKYLIQLILSPSSGWEDIEKDNPSADTLARKGLYPLLGVTALTELFAFIYQRHTSIVEVLVRMLADFGAYFVGIFIARLIFELYLGRICDDEPDRRRVAVLTVCGIGLMVLVQLLCNCLPWNLVLLKFLPVYVILVMYKSMAYAGVRKSEALRYVGLSAVAIVIVPLAIYYLLYLLV